LHALYCVRKRTHHRRGLLSQEGPVFAERSESAEVRHCRANLIKLDGKHSHPRRKVVKLDPAHFGLHDFMGFCPVYAGSFARCRFVFESSPCAVHG
jgi:hypothetical protein